MDIKDMMKDLEQKRDELKLKAHLFNSEVKESWSDLEKKFTRLKSRSQSALKATDKASKNIAEANGLLIDEIKRGYKEIRRSV